MEFSVDMKGSVMIVNIAGEIDHHAANKIRDKLDFALMRKEIKHLVFDLSKISMMDSAGIGLLIGRYKIIKQRKGRAVIIVENMHVKKILKMSGVLGIFKQADSVEDAMRMLSRPSMA